MINDKPPPEYIPSSPPLPSLCAPLSPTSSEPPIFSSDDPMMSEDVTNYESPRDKRKRAGPWWEGDGDDAVLTVNKRQRQLTRNIDSGVYMQWSDDVWRMEAEVPKMDSLEAQFFRELVEGVEANRHIYTYEGKALQDQDLQHVSLLEQVTVVPPNPGTEVPAESQFRSMIPELVLQLGYNGLKHLHPKLFQVESLTFLSLHHNCIKELPASISKLRNLRTLNLAHNKLAYLPHELQYLCAPNGKLERLDLAANPLLEKINTKVFRQNFAEVRNVVQSEKLIKDILWPAFRTNKQENLLWLLAWLESFSPNEPQAFKRVVKDKRVLIGSTPITYYNSSGRIVKGSPRPAQFSSNDYDVIVPTSQGMYYSNSTSFFKPPPSSKVPTLFTLALNRAVQEALPTELTSLLNDIDIPLQIEASLEIAKDNLEKEHFPLRPCRCGKQFVVPQAEWIEFWCDSVIEIIPFRSVVCSWECANKNQGYVLEEQQQQP